MITTDADVIVVGGGASGCIAAGFAAGGGAGVLLLERNARPARKILVTGKGRCNLTNDCAPEEFLRHVRHGEKFLYSAINRFPPRKTKELFESLGTPLKTERGRRVFPVSDRAMDIADALQRFAGRAGITRVCGRVQKLTVENGVLTGVLTEDGRAYRAKRVVLATGGMSYPALGSTGDGYALARSVGHDIVEPRPSLVGIETAEDFSALAGLTLKNVTLRLYKKGGKKPLYSELGELLFTHGGVSGPLALTASSFMDGPAEAYAMELDLKPGLTAEQLDARILRDVDENQNKSIQNTLAGLLPHAMIPMVMNRARLPLGTKANQFTREQRAVLTAVLKAFPVTPAALGDIEGAVITAGGVDTRQVDPKTMESKLLSGLYFAGELLDLDAETGGYNLQIAFATGFAAGTAAGDLQKVQENDPAEEI